MSEAPRMLPLRVLLQRTLYAIVAPQRVFHAIMVEERMPWGRAILFILLAGFLDTIVHPYFTMGQWLFQLAPESWCLIAAGWAGFIFNQWLLALLTFAVLHRLLRGPVKTLAPFGIASFYLIGGFGVIGSALDLLHRLFHITQVAIRFPGLPSFGAQPIFGHLRLPYLVSGPWFGASLWLSFRHLLGFRGSRQLLLAAILAVVLPIGGRLLIEPLPFFVLLILDHQLGWHPPFSSTVLVTHVVLAGVAWGILNRVRRVTSPGR